MKSIVVQLLRRTGLYEVLHKAIYAPIAERRKAREDAAVIRSWEDRGRPVPPPHIVKQATLLELALRHDCRVLVETGTYRGDMVDAMKRRFDAIYSIELGEKLHRDAVRKFRDYAHIHLIHGDSGTELGRLMQRLDRRALFWLDGHYSGGVTAKGEKHTPIFDELDHVLRAPDLGHVIVIDDARKFGKHPEYPTLEELAEFVARLRPGANLRVDADGIQITWPPAGA